MNKHASIGALALTTAAFITAGVSVAPAADPPVLNCLVNAPCADVPFVGLPQDGPDNAADATPVPSHLIEIAPTLRRPIWYNNTMDWPPRHHPRRSMPEANNDAAWMPTLPLRVG
jgi:hypothetical protein